MEATMTALLASLAEIFTAVFGYVGTIATSVVSTPLLLLGVGVGFVGMCIGIFARMLRSA